MKVAEQLYRRTVIAAFEEAENALVNLDAHRQQREQLQQQVDHLRQVAAQVEAQLAAGIASQLEVFETERSLLGSAAGAAGEPPADPVRHGHALQGARWRLADGQCPQRRQTMIPIAPAVAEMAAAAASRSSTSCSSRCPVRSWATSASTAPARHRPGRSPVRDLPGDSWRDCRAGTPGSSAIRRRLCRRPGEQQRHDRQRPRRRHIPPSLRDGDEVCFGGELSYRVHMTPRASAPERTTRLVARPSTSRRSGLQPIVITRFPFLVSKTGGAALPPPGQVPAPAELPVAAARAHLPEGRQRLHRGPGQHQRHLRRRPAPAGVRGAAARTETSRVRRRSFHLPGRHSPGQPRSNSTVTKGFATRPLRKSPAIREKTTFVAAATSFLDIFCVGRRVAERRRGQHRDLKQSAAADQEADRRPRGAGSRSFYPSSPGVRRKRPGKHQACALVGGFGGGGGRRVRNLACTSAARPSAK